ncbi:polysaccharide deacetylase family protein [Neptuniibacter sp. QD37_6]|uniref:polysaccharide deacetylase family protein n=1 Tax=Neptuniibacter sp. QD37_6 TaxID=3398210 RepID=UPI0039F59CF8
MSLLHGEEEEVEFKVKIPGILFKEQSYTLDVILGEFLGLVFEVETHSSDKIEIYREGKSAKLTLDTSFFQRANNAWLKPESMPLLPLDSWESSCDGIDANIVTEPLPILYGMPGLVRYSNRLHLNLDVFGSIFFMLSRYEELVMPDRDHHNRFPATASIAYKESFLNRPIVNEYVNILWFCMCELWGDIERSSNKPSMLVSCDVDQPYDCTVETLPKLFKTCVADLIKRRSLLEMLKRINRYVFNKISIYQFDRNYTFDWYMDICEQADLKVAFYFIPTSIEPNNGCYEVFDNKIISLMKKIAARGHEIGVHGSYQTYRDKNKMRRQKEILEAALRRAGIRQKIKGNRQHYLMFDAAVTPDYLDSAGFQYDASGGYADCSGFRFGTSKEFSMWGWMSESKLQLKQRPLIVMECSVISDSYAGLGCGKEALDLMLGLKQESQNKGGCFTLLWHNSNLRSKEERVLFKSVLGE